jgi:hypothetical protein
MPLSQPLPLPSLEYKSFLGRWLAGGESLQHEQEHGPGPTHPWYKVIWLTGVDYFSTLGYQPGIALLAAGAVAPIATSILVLVTLLGALPVYAQVAARSYAGQGSIAMLENLLHGWKGKLLVLILLGFAATDFVITMTLSAADAAKHAIENPYFHPILGEHQMGVTLILLVALAIVFLKGFKEAIGVASSVAIPYIVLNFVILLRCLSEVLSHPTLLGDWRNALSVKGDWTMIAVAAVLVFPKLALGLSGFETGVSVMPMIDGGPADEHRQKRGAGPPKGRIAATLKLLIGAASLMSVLLILSSFVTTLLIPEEAYQIGGKASGRAIAYLAHQYFGGVFGTVYDVATILILSLAGASAMAGLLHLIPRYLPRFGMAPLWVSLSRPLVLVLLAINILVTLIFKADVEAQSGAYATGVLVLITSAAFAATLALWNEKRRLFAAYSAFLTLVFIYTLLDNCIERPDGLIIGAFFILFVLIVSGLSRYLRSTEMRITGLRLADDESRSFQSAVVGKKVHLVPIACNTPEARLRKKQELLAYYNVPGPLAFIHVNLLDNRSEFLGPVEVEIRESGGDFIIEVYNAIAIANTIAYASELMDPISIFIGLTRQNLMQQALRYMLFGEGETGLMVYTILLKYWEWTPEDDVRPFIFLMSD